MYVFRVGCTQYKSKVFWSIGLKMFFLKTLGQSWLLSHLDTLMFTHSLELMRSVGSNGSLSLLFMLKVMAWHFVRDTHMVITTRSCHANWRYWTFPPWSLYSLVCWPSFINLTACVCLWRSQSGMFSLCLWHSNMWMYSISCSLMGLELWGCGFVAASTGLSVSLPKTRPRHARDFAYQAACLQQWPLGP
jgi:hypothetical protein